MRRTRRTTLGPPAMPMTDARPLGFRDQKRNDGSPHHLGDERAT